MLINCTDFKLTPQLVALKQLSLGQFFMFEFSVVSVSLSVMSVIRAVIYIYMLVFLFTI